MSEPDVLGSLRAKTAASAAANSSATRPSGTTPRSGGHSGCGRPRAAAARDAPALDVVDRPDGPVAEQPGGGESPGEAREGEQRGGTTDEALPVVDRQARARRPPVVVTRQLPV